MSNEQIVDKQTIWAVIWSSSLGTLIEWYDFYIFGTLSAIISKQFFPPSNPTAALLATLATFAAGFLVRPFGALFFGRLGDIVGRKYTFLLTLVLMGGATFLIGCIPGYASWGFAAPIIILLLRLIQGLAIGGEYGGAATYVSEHCEPEDRGFYTSFIQTTATLGLFLALAVIFFVTQKVGKEAFAEWGWRIPFLISAALVIVSIYIRLSMAESPTFAKIKKEGKTSTNPLKESFGNKENLKMVLLALFGAVAGQGCVWYTGQFYAMGFIQNTLKVEDTQRLMIMLLAIALATPFYIFWAWVSDKMGRKWIMMAGMILAVLTYRPVFQKFAELAKHPVTGMDKQGVDAAKSGSMMVAALDKNGVDSIKTTTKYTSYTDGTYVKAEKKVTVLADKTKPAVKDADSKTVWLNASAWSTMMWLVFYLIFLVTMVYAPMAAYLVELFPARIRYTSLSLPYHIGNGVFGGLVPFVATALSQGDKIYDGLYYPLGVALLTFVIGSLFLSNKMKEHIVD